MKTLIVIDNLNPGGVASSLYNFLNYAHKQMDCDLLVFNEQSIQPDEIPDNVKILPPKRLLHILGKTQSEITAESKSMAFFRLILIALSKFFNGEFARSFLWFFIRKTGHYDLAISYAQDDSWKSLSKGCNDFVIKKVNAPHKAVVIHCDYSNFGGYHARQSGLLGCFDNIICVSHSCRKSFLSCFPSLNDKVIVCENFINIDKIRRLAKNPIDYPLQNINFVSVCRLSVVKGLSRTLEAFKELFREGYSNFTWTIVGDGPEYESLQQEIHASGLSEKITLVGQQINPYQYMANASVFLLPSLHEAAPMVYGENAVLHLPVLTTETCSAVELVKERSIGIVAENSKSGIKNALKDILEEKTVLDGFRISDEDINRHAEKQFGTFISSFTK